MIALLAFEITEERRREAYGCGASATGYWRDPPASVRIEIAADGTDLKRLIAALVALMPEAREAAERQGHPLRALPSRAIATTSEPIIIDGVLEDP